MNVQTDTAPVLSVIEKTIHDDPRFHTLLPWMSHLRFTPMDDGSLAVAVTHPRLTDALSEDVFLHLADAARTALGRDLRLLRAHAPALPSPQLHPGLTFDTFYTGASNRLAYAAAQAISANPGASYNPLFLHAGIGLGKTHLLQAIYRAFTKEYPTSLPVYFSAETFLADYLSLPEPRFAEMKQRLIQADLFLFDDIDRLGNEDEASAALLDLFNSLFDCGAQLVFASSKAPRSLDALDNRLRSRLQWGLVVEMETPDASTRAELVRKKAAQKGFQLPPAVEAYLAEQTVGSIRELEGILQRLHSHATLLQGTIDLPLVHNVLSEYARQPRTTVTLDEIRDFICKKFSVSSEELHSKSRTRSIAYPRQIAMYLGHTYTTSSLEEIGRYFGGRDHSTVKHGCEKIKTLLKSDSSLRSLVAQFRQSICQPR